MKFFILCLVVFPFFMSCSEASDTVPVSETALPNDYFFAKKYAVIGPGNPINPYDVAGQLHTDLYAAYYDNDSLPVSLSEVLDRVFVVAAQHETFGFTPSSIQSIDENTLSSLLVQIDCCSSEILYNSFTTAAAAEGFQNFMLTFVSLCDEEDDYSILHSFVTSYEQFVLEAIMASADKQAILISTSIIRYSTYERKKRPKKNSDPEWDLMIGNVMGSVAGAADGVEAAVIKSLVCGILENGGWE